MQIITIRLSKKYHEWLVNKSIDNDTTLSDIVRKALVKFSENDKEPLLPATIELVIPCNGGDGF